MQEVKVIYRLQEKPSASDTPLDTTDATKSMSPTNSQRPAHLVERERHMNHRVLT